MVADLASIGDSTLWCVGNDLCCKTANGCAAIDLYEVYQVIPVSAVRLSLATPRSFTVSSVLSVRATVHVPSTTVGAARTITTSTVITTTEETTFTSVAAKVTVWVTVTTTTIAGGRGGPGTGDLGVGTTPQVDTFVETGTAVITSDLTTVSNGITTVVPTTISTTGAITRLSTRSVTFAPPVFTGAPLLTGSCASTYWTVLPFANGDLLEVPLVGCGRDRSDCCPSGSGVAQRAVEQDPIIASVARIRLERCPADYQKIGDTLCCPS